LRLAFFAKTRLCCPFERKTVLLGSDGISTLSRKWKENSEKWDIFRNSFGEFSVDLLRDLAKELLYGVVYKDLFRDVFIFSCRTRIAMDYYFAISKFGKRNNRTRSDLWEFYLLVGNWTSTYLALSLPILGK
jgi:hypothetical protein